jgi:hypothetical protein
LKLDLISHSEWIVFAYRLMPYWSIYRLLKFALLNSIIPENNLPYWRNICLKQQQTMYMPRFNYRHTNNNKQTAPHNIVFTELSQSQNTTCCHIEYNLRTAKTI